MYTDFLREAVIELFRRLNSFPQVMLGNEPDKIARLMQQISSDLL